MSADKVIEIARRMCATHREPDLTTVRNELRAALAEYDAGRREAETYRWRCLFPHICGREYCDCPEIAGSADPRP